MYMCIYSTYTCISMKNILSFVRCMYECLQQSSNELFLPEWKVPQSICITIASSGRATTPGLLVKASPSDSVSGPADGFQLLSIDDGNGKIHSYSVLPGCLYSLLLLSLSETYTPPLLPLPILSSSLHPPSFWLNSLLFPSFNLSPLSPILLS